MNTQHLPSFIVTGGARCGTTYLFGLLNQHPKIFLKQPRTADPITKDSYFFSHEGYRNPSVDIENYKTYYLNAKPDQILGEIATSYDFYPWVPSLLREYLSKDLKLVFLVRNPIKRAYAHYWISFMRGKEVYSFMTAIKKEPLRLNPASRTYLSNMQNYSYFSRGFYYANIDRYLGYFPKSNIKIIVSEDLYKQPLLTVNEILDFLEIDSLMKVDLNREKNSTQLPGNLFFFRFMKYVKYSTQGLPFFWRFSSMAKNVLSKMPLSERTYPDIHPRIVKNLSLKYAQDIRLLSEYMGRDMFNTWNIK